MSASRRRGALADRRPSEIIRALQVIPGLAMRQGGPSFNAIGIARAVRSAGATNSIYATDMREAASSRHHTRVSLADLPPEGASLDIRLFPAQHPFKLAYSPSLGTALRRVASSYSVVHIHSLYLYPQLAAFRAARDAGVPHVITIHGALDPALRRRGRLRKAAVDVLWQRRMLETAAALHFTTDTERDLVEDLHLTPRPFVIPNGVDFRRFDTPVDVRSFRKRWGLDGRPVVLFLGRLSHKKGIELLIPAMANVDANLIVAGPDDENLTPALKSLARSSKVADRVVFTGMIDGRERVAAYQSSELYVLPSSTENFGTTVLEAMASGTPTLLSPFVNLAPEAERCGAASIVPREIDSISVAIRELLADGGRRECLIHRGRAFANAYSWESIGPQIVEMYSYALGMSR